MMHLNKISSRRSLVLLVLCGAALIGGLAATALATRQSAQQSIVSINLGSLLSGLDETTKIRAKLNDMAEEIKSYNATKQAELKAMQEELAILEAGLPAHVALQEKIITEAANLRAWMEVKTGLRDIEESKQYLHLYRKVVEAASMLAQQQGYDYVLLDDTGIEFRGAAAPQDTLAQLFTRRLIYANPARDVTEELKTRMNNAFNAGGG